MTLTIQLNELKDFLFEYITRYRKIYELFTSQPPEGAGYPKIWVSPYLESEKFDIYLTTDGVVINEVTNGPNDSWFIFGGPALKVDYEPTRTPLKVRQIISENGLEGKDTGIYSFLAEEQLPIAVWQGRVENISKQELYTNHELGVSLNLIKVETSTKQLIRNLTFGILGTVIEPHLPDETRPFGDSYIIENLGFFPADLNNYRFFNYLEIHGHCDISAWDNRLINLRAKNDLRRDFAKILSKGNAQGGGYLFLGDTNQWTENYTNRLGTLKKAIDEFRDILAFQSDATEDVFHNLIKKHPILLDVYGRCVSKPKLRYPEGQTSPIGKTYVEPDFIVVYQNQSYKLVELERASKNIATKQGQPRAEVGQAVFQTAEWVHYIRENFNEIRSEYPGIHTKYQTCVVISRSRQNSFKDTLEMNRYKELLLLHYSIHEMLTYDDLFERACSAYTLLTGLSPNSI